MATVYTFDKHFNEDRVYVPAHDVIDISTLRVEEGLVIHTDENDRIDFLGKFAIDESFLSCIRE